MPVLFKDFDKDVADFFKKHYVEGTKGFKFEAKAKGQDKEIYVNPGFEKGTFTVNFQYDSKKDGIKSKLGLSNNDTAVAKVSLERQGHKCELTETLKLKNLTDYAGEFAHEWKNAAIGVYSKSTFGAGAPCNTELHVSLAAHKVLDLGAQVNFSACTRALSLWKAGARFSCCKSNLVAASYDSKGCASVAAMGNVAQLKGADVAAIVRLINAKGQTSADFGIQTKCPITGALLRLKSNLAGNYGIALTKAFGGVSVTLGGEGKVGEIACPFAPGKLSVTVVSE